MKRLVIVKVNSILNNTQQDVIRQRVINQLEQGVLVTDLMTDIITKCFNDDDTFEVIVKPKKKGLFEKKK